MFKLQIWPYRSVLIAEPYMILMWRWLCGIRCLCHQIWSNREKLITVCTCYDVIDKDMWMAVISQEPSDTIHRPLLININFALLKSIGNYFYNSFNMYHRRYGNGKIWCILDVLQRYMISGGLYTLLCQCTCLPAWGTVIICSITKLEMPKTRTTYPAFTMAGKLNMTGTIVGYI